MSTFSGFEHIIREQEPLAPLTWFRLGGNAEYFAEPTRVEELCELLSRCYESELPVRVLGAGSRVLVPDDGIQGLVIHLSAPAFCQIQVAAPEITVGGGAKLSHVVSAAVGAGLAGLENLVGIPGTVAGALRSNARSLGSSIGQWTQAATLINRRGEIMTRQRGEMRFSYGESSLDELVLLDARFTLETADPAELTRRMQKSWIVKRAAQPSTAMGIGRIFKDAQGMPAEEVMEQANLRGASVGKARVADGNANYIVTEPGATSQDVTQLMEQMRDKVSAELGIDLEYELEVW